MASSATAADTTHPPMYNMANPLHLSTSVRGEGWAASPASPGAKHLMRLPQQLSATQQATADSPPSHMVQNVKWHFKRVSPSANYRGETAHRLSESIRNCLMRLPSRSHPCDPAVDHQNTGKWAASPATAETPPIRRIRVHKIQRH